jgi:hypothetical protein
VKAALKLELIGENYFAYQRTARWRDAETERYGRMLGLDQSPVWVARIVGIEPDGNWQRIFLHGQKDYTHANRNGSRGVFCYYALDDGTYEVHERTNWKKTRRYFLVVEEGAYREADREEVLLWLSADSASAS